MSAERYWTFINGPVQLQRKYLVSHDTTLSFSKSDLLAIKIIVISFYNKAYDNQMFYNT